MESLFDFEAFNDEDFDRLYNETMENKSENFDANSYKKCDNCDIQMSPNINNTLLCKGCGFMKTTIIDNTEYEPSMTDYNTSSNYHVPIKCVGKNAYQYQKQLRNNTSQYCIIQETNLRRKLEKLNFNSEVIKLPKNILANVLLQYKIIRDTSKIHRGEILKGMIGALLYYECLKEGIVRKPKEISNWFKINENDLSKGDKILRDLDEKGIIKLPLYDDNNEILL